MIGLARSGLSRPRAARAPVRARSGRALLQSIARATLLSTLALALPACTADDVVARARDHDATVAPDRDAALAAYCEGEGPPVIVSDSGAAICSGGLAERTFRYALCACEGWVAAAPLVTDSFASADGPYSSLRSGRAGSVGSNARIALNAPATITGALWCADGLAAGGAATLTVGSDLHAGAAIESDAAVDVERDAFVAGSVRASTLRVGGVLTLPDGATIDTTVPPTLGGERRAPVTVPPPCACDAADLLDVAALVASHATDNDDALVGLDPRALDGYSGPTTLTLPCGRLYLARIAGDGDLTLVVTGRTALFVAGDLSFDGRFTVTLDGPGAELDLFVAGDLGVDRVLRLGDELRPARVRLYVGGAGSVSLSADGVFGGNLYAPRAELVAAGEVHVYGSAFVRRMSASGPVWLHYDTSVLRAGDPCPPRDPPTCSSCLDCRDQACVEGACAPCADSSQCCAPLVCVAGRCAPEPF